MKKGLLLGEPNHQVKEVSGDGREEKKGLLLGKPTIQSRLVEMG